MLEETGWYDTVDPSFFAFPALHNFMSWHLGGLCKDKRAFMWSSPSYLRSASLHYQEAAIRVMTIHQAKGLGFDIVILPDLMGRDITRDDVDLALARDAGNAPQWALKMPRRIVADNDPALTAQVLACDEESSFEELCVLYVAMTRARYGLYLLTAYPGKSSEAFTAASFVKQQLTGMLKPEDGPRVTIGGENFVCLYEHGERDWYRGIPVRAPEAAAAAERLPPGFRTAASSRPRLCRLEPSAEEDIRQKASYLFSAETRDVLDFGSAVHELFAQVEWLPDADADAIVADWEGRTAASDDVKRDACTQFRDALRSPAAASVLSRPEGGAELWREKPFEVVLEGNQWVTGIFDRVTIRRDARGRAVEATVLDYKSDRIQSPSQLAAAADRYRPQLKLYRQALAQILSVPLASIRLQIFFTRVGQTVEL